MYRQVATDSYFELKNGERKSPLATLEDDFGGRIQIGTDDHCYVVYIRVENYYVPTHHLPDEVAQVLGTLACRTCRSCSNPRSTELVIVWVDV